MTVVSVEIVGLRQGEFPAAVLEFENGQRITVPLDSKPENEAVLARVFGEDAAAEA